MGARAHGRRHEGRRIRKNRRQFRELCAAFTAFGRAAEFAAAHLGDLMASFSENVRGIEEQNRLWRERHEGLLASTGVGVPYPTQSGGEDARGPLRGVAADLAYIDETVGL